MRHSHLARRCRSVSRCNSFLALISSLMIGVIIFRIGPSCRAAFVVAVRMRPGGAIKRLLRAARRLPDPLFSLCYITASLSSYHCILTHPDRNFGSAVLGIDHHISTMVCFGSAVSGIDRHISTTVCFGSAVSGIDRHISTMVCFGSAVLGIDRHISTMVCLITSAMRCS